MNENSTLDEASLARQALQESMDLRDQGHSTTRPATLAGPIRRSPPHARPPRPLHGLGRPSASRYLLPRLDTMTERASTSLDIAVIGGDGIGPRSSPRA